MNIQEYCRKIKDEERRKYNIFIKYKLTTLLLLIITFFHSQLLKPFIFPAHTAHVTQHTATHLSPFFTAHFFLPLTHTHGFHLTAAPRLLLFAQLTIPYLSLSRSLSSATSHTTSLTLYTKTTPAHKYIYRRCLDRLTYANRLKH